jgi:hypothetical protein
MVMKTALSWLLQRLSEVYMVDRFCVHSKSEHFEGGSG